MNADARPDVDAVLAGLKDFQRETVDYAFARLYTDESPTHRMLIADEVGLGKTLVARGLVARAVDHLWDDVPRIDIVYVCSNADIARQNIARLRLPGQEDFALASRITLLPTKLHHLSTNKLNFVSLTPGTSFERGSHLGTAEERALLWHLLERAWGRLPPGAAHLLRGWAGLTSFCDTVRSTRPGDIDDELAGRFIARLADADEARFRELCDRFRQVGDDPGNVDTADQAAFVSDLRRRLALVCVDALEPDVVILDEFQRFSHLLDGDDDASALAQQLFTYSGEHSDVRVILLSATPYKMYTVAREAEGDDHYRDFLKTTGFLLDDPGLQEGLGRALTRYRSGLYDLADGIGPELRDAQDDLERRLRRVIVRTERLGASADRDGMLVEVSGRGLHLERSDVEGYLSLARVGRHLGEGESLEYWKSAPYCLEFMDGYQLKKSFRAAVDAPRADATFESLLREAQGLLRRADVEAYRALDPANARLRSLLDDVIEAGLWRLLWMPPTLPYWAPAGPYADLPSGEVTKRLIFSSWQVVPKVIAGLISYEAERRMIRLHEKHPRNTIEARRRRRPLLNIAVDRSSGEDRLTGMPVLGLMYPSPALTALVDPLVAGRDGRAASEELVDALTGQLQPWLDQLGARPGEGRADEQWYWAAPLLLDAGQHAQATAGWLARPSLPATWSGGDTESAADGGRSRWVDHVDLAHRTARGEIELGPAPEDLATVLAQMALGAPGTVLLRAMARQHRTGRPLWSPALRDAAARAAWAFRGLFNTPEASALLRGLDEDDREPYWRRVVEYAIAGNLQSVLDEYAHLLFDSMRLVDREPDDAAQRLGTTIAEAVSLRTSGVSADLVEFDGARPALGSLSMRGRFARRFDRTTSDGGGEQMTAEHVRGAFNSPFWPFVLASTSVGQEGLDFHPYCHAVVHWNLPHNPVDMEQREGRVHRFKNHAVRKNLARRYGLAAVVGERDPWEHLFTLGQRDRPAGSSDLVPFWVYPARGDQAATDGISTIAKIERHVPSLPLSREADRIGDLRRSLAVYRMVFGQPRQEDLLDYLLERLGDEEARQCLNELRIDLSPRGSRAEQLSTGEIERETHACGERDGARRMPRWLGRRQVGR